MLTCTLVTFACFSCGGSEKRDGILERGGGGIGGSKDIHLHQRGRRRRLVAQHLRDLNGLKADKTKKEEAPE